MADDVKAGPDGVTTGAILKELIALREGQFAAALAEAGKKKKAAADAADMMATGMKQLAHDLEHMGVIRIVREGESE